MKLTIALLLLATSFNLQANCIIKGYKWKDTAKTIYIEDVKISRKVQDALAIQCRMDIKTMTLEQRQRSLKSDYLRKLKKLK